MPRRAWSWWLALSVPVALCYPWLPSGSLIAGIGFEGVGAIACLVMMVAIRRLRPPNPRMWWLLAAGNAASVVGDLVYDYLLNVAHVDAYPSVADIFYLLSYPVTVGGLGLLVRGRTRGRDRVGLVDAAIISTALALPAWTFVIRPISAMDHQGLGDQLVSLAYPIFDVLLVVMTARLVMTPGARRLPFATLMLIVAQVTRLVSDVAFSATSITGADFPWLDGGWILTYLLTTAAVLHPSAARIGEPGPHRDAGVLSTPRLTLLAAASLLAPVVLAVQGLRDRREIDWLAVAAGSTVLFLLVVARMKLLLDRVQGQARQLDQLAHLDGLTGVPNRRSWDEALSRELARARRSGEPVVAGLLDLDFFKRFNDAYGHQAGDLLLKEAAATWRALLRDPDVLARYGGEEFGVVIAGLPAEEALTIVSRLRPATPRGQTFSAGLAEWDGTEPADELVRRADEALYQAKAAGRDRVLLAKNVTLAG
ncbi:GGDEF domain-containing protein [Paractinoplanes globisporus]|uniref:Diguanylate cyclase n=1 Tax=Paractinoplanes globisporus TaxID=113565 RepID=A0ABW6WWJ2_9ACTN|nr:GGDEF domain-containing protein [Actinoplanes globisporus]